MSEDIPSEAFAVNLLEEGLQIRSAGEDLAAVF
jgi:hypothetical protein